MYTMKTVSIKRLEQLLNINISMTMSIKKIKWDIS